MGNLPLLIALGLLVLTFSILTIRSVRRQDKEWEDREYNKAFKRLGLYQQGYDEQEEQKEKLKNDELYIEDTQRFLKNAKIVEDNYKPAMFSDYLSDSGIDDEVNEIESSEQNVELPEQGFFKSSHSDSFTSDTHKSKPIDDVSFWNAVKNLAEEGQETVKRQPSLEDNRIGQRDATEWLEDLERQSRYLQQPITVLIIYRAIEDTVRGSRFKDAAQIAFKRLVGKQYAEATRYISRAQSLWTTRARQDYEYINEVEKIQNLYSNNLISTSTATEMVNKLMAEKRDYNFELNEITKEFYASMSTLPYDHQQPDIEGFPLYGSVNDGDWQSYNLSTIGSNKTQKLLLDNVTNILFPEYDFASQYCKRVGKKGVELLRITVQNALTHELRLISGDQWLAKNKYGVAEIDTIKAPEMFILMSPPTGALIASGYLLSRRPNYYFQASDWFSDKDYKFAEQNSVITNEILKKVANNAMTIYNIANPKDSRFRTAFRMLPNSSHSFFVMANNGSSTINYAFLKSLYAYESKLLEVIFELPKTIYNVPVKYYTEWNNWSSIYPVIVAVRRKDGTFVGYSFQRDLKTFCSFDLENLSEEIAEDNVPDSALENPFELPVFSNVPFSVNPFTIKNLEDPTSTTSARKKT